MSDVILNLLSLAFAGLVLWVLVIRPAFGRPAIPPRSPRAKPSAPAPDFLEPGTQNAAAGTDLLSTLERAQHVLVIGPTRSGKTSLVHELSQHWRAEASVLVLDPDAAPGLWAGCDVFGAGDNFAGIDTALAALLSELEDRRRQRARGVRQFRPIRVILTETADVMHQCQNARPVFEAVLRRGAKLNIGLVVDVQDRQRKTLAIDGQTHLLDNFDTLVEVRKQADGRRVAVVKRGEDSTEYAIPRLPDLDKLQAAAPVLPAAPEPANERTNERTNGTAMPETAASVPFVRPKDRMALIRQLREWGWSKTDIRDELKGTAADIGAAIRQLEEEGDTDEQSA